VSHITVNIQKILAELPSGVELVTVVKGRSPDEILEAIEAGAKVIGENYLQEADKARETVGNRVKWHFIGHLQRNKVKKAIGLFDTIETVDSLALAHDLDKHCGETGTIMPVMVEVNSGREPQKWGVLPEQVKQVVEGIAHLSHLKVTGLMTMGPRVGNPEDARAYFVTTRHLFEEIRSHQLPNVEMKYLSMGMSNSYRVALQEGANIIRLGRQIFEK
jgi:PLP dependent protein